MSVSLKRHAELESVTWQARTGVDGQGRPSYASPGTVLQARVERMQEVIRLGTGEEVKIDATVWFDFAASLPTSDDRLVLSDLTGIVLMRDQPADLQTAGVDHVEVQIRQE
ncbi:MAG: hypothetical protein ACRD3C_17525 [Vicinamibacterales bacterium]